MKKSKYPIGSEKLSEMNARDKNGSLLRRDGRSIAYWIMDSFLIVLASPLLLILFIIVSLTVRAKLGSPIFFSQLRSGFLGKHFRIFKFRSMSQDCDQDGNLLPDSERVTDFGIRIRAMRLDELPAFYHILRGEMSLVGPRPLLPDTVAKNKLGLLRQQVKPGFTGLAQVSGNTLLSDDEKFALDCYYISEISLYLNLKIILKTLLVITTKETRDEAMIAKAIAHCSDVASRGK